MRTENLSNDTQKVTPSKSSIKNIDLGNQLFNVGSSGQSFDQILGQQVAKPATGNAASQRQEADAVSKRATARGASGKSLPAEDRRQRLEDRQEKLALQEKQRQKSEAQQARADSVQERQQSSVNKQEEAAKQAKAEAKPEAETEETPDTGEHAPVSAQPSPTESGSETEAIGDEITHADGELSDQLMADKNVADQAESSEAEALALDEMAPAVDGVLETESELELAPETTADADASKAVSKEEVVASDAAALIEEVLAASVEAEIVTDEETADAEDSLVRSPESGAALMSMSKQASNVNSGMTASADEALVSPAAAQNTTTAAGGQSGNNLNANASLAVDPKAGAVQAENSHSGDEDPGAAMDLLNKSAEKFTDALDSSKLESAKASKSTVINEQGATPVQERLAALAKSLEKPSKEGESSFQRKATESIDGAKASSFQRNVDQFNRLQGNAAKPLTTTIATPMNQKEWAGEVGQRLMMMVSSKVQSAQIQITPGDMGPIDVKVSMQKDQAHVVFTSHVPQTRDALEQALPKLREMLDQNGVAMGNVDVRDQGTQHSAQRQGQDQRQQSRAGSDETTASADSGAEMVSVQQLGVVDYYA